jgi:PAS domain S-box-containing protein
MSQRLLTIAEAATVLGLPVSGVEALVGAGYLQVDARADRLAASEVKAFQARNSTGGTTVADVIAEVSGPHSAAEEILDDLAQSIPEMARRAADIVAGAFPEAAAWTAVERRRFEAQAAGRFDAILSITRSEAAADDELFEGLSDAGGAAAFAGAPLPQMLLTLRISRDLMVQTAVSAAEERGTRWGLALAVVLTRVLPVLDRLTDSVARGYWSAVVTREQEAFARYEHVVEHSSNGVYEIALDGIIEYVNPMMAVLCGRPREDLLGEAVVDALPAADATEDAGDVYCVPTSTGWRPLRVVRADGVERDILVQVTQRTEHGQPVGFDGIVRDVTAERALERQKNDFLALITEELRQPLTTILGLGVTLSSYAAELPRDRMARMGDSIHVQSERIARLADDLHDVSRLRADRLTVSLRTVDVGRAVDAALGMVPGTAAVAVDAPHDLHAIADGRRLEQVIAHLVENALRHGAAPVCVRAHREHPAVCIVVVDSGDGVPAEHVDSLFGALAPTVPGNRLRDRASGLGLPLACTLVEAMGGRLDYQRDARGGARFTVSLPAAAPGGP